MENKKVRFALVLLFFVLFTTEVFAKSKKKADFEDLEQEEWTAESYFIKDTEDGESQFVQRFEWDEDPYVLKYQFILEQIIEKGETEELFNEETEENFVEIPLKAGSYRYKIIVFNLLGLMEENEEWTNFDVLKAYQPEIKDVSPSTIYLEEPQDGIFTINGLELRPETEFVFLAAKIGKLPAQIIENDPKNRKVKIQVDPNMLDSFKYVLRAKNQGGLISEFAPVTVKFKKPVDFDVAAGYACPVNIKMGNMFGQDATVMNTYVGKAYPISFAAKMTFIPFKKRIGYFGIGVNATYSRTFKNEDQYLLDGNLITGFANFVYQYPFRKPLDDGKSSKLVGLLEFHGGVGIAYLMDYKFKFKHDVTTPPLNSINLAGQVGIGGQRYFTNRLFAEVDLDATLAVGSDFSMLNFVPSAYIGWQF